MELHRADRRYRVRAGLALAACVIAGGLVLAWLNAWLNDLESGGQLFGEQRLGLWLFAGALSTLLVLTCGAAAFALHRLATRISSEQRYPPQDMLTASDVVVRRGAAADAMATRIRRVSWCLVGLAALLAAWGGWMLYAVS